MIVVMGVSGCGKSAVSEALAGKLGVPFCEGDALHSRGNLAKMRAGVVLDDEDRLPWLTACNAWLRRQTGGGVISCSALKRSYRDRLRAGVEDRVGFVLWTLRGACWRGA